MHFGKSWQSVMQPKNSFKNFGKDLAFFGRWKEREGEDPSHRVWPPTVLLIVQYDHRFPTVDGGQASDMVVQAASGGPMVKVQAQHKLATI